MCTLSACVPVCTLSALAVNRISLTSSVRVVKLVSYLVTSDLRAAICCTCSDTSRSWDLRICYLCFSCFSLSSRLFSLTCSGSTTLTPGCSLLVFFGVFFLVLFIGGTGSVRTGGTESVDTGGPGSACTGVTGSIGTGVTGSVGTDVTGSVAVGTGGLGSVGTLWM